jgi:hypothetical protein
VEITAAALDLLADRLAEEGHDACFRAVLEEDDLHLEVGTPKASDVVVRHDGQAVLVLDPTMAELLDGWVLDADGEPGEDQRLLLIPAPEPPDEPSED